jgi:endonuclease/exonuclease/phosphatase (EEP) superfamily protein YafD
MATRWRVWFWREARAWALATVMVFFAVAAWGFVPLKPALLFNHGALLALPVTLLAFVLLWFQGRLGPAIASLASLLSLLFLVWPRTDSGELVFQASRRSAKPETQPGNRAEGTFHLLQLNVSSGRHRDLSSLSALLAAGAFDVIALQECTSACYEEISESLAKKGYYSINESEGRLALLSRFALSAPHAGREPPFLQADLVLKNGRRLRVVTTHLTRPWPFGDSARHEAQIEAAFSRIRKSDLPTVLLGDFNAAPWFPSLRSAREAAGFDEARLPAFAWATWPARLPHIAGGVSFPLPVIPLDHVFTRGAMETVSWRVGDTVGSEHRPVMVTVSLDSFP